VIVTLSAGVGVPGLTQPGGTLVSDLMRAQATVKQARWQSAATSPRAF